MHELGCMKPHWPVALSAMFVLSASCASGPPPSSTGASSVPSAVSAQARATGTRHLTKVQHLVAKGRQEGLKGLYALVRNGHTMYCWRDRNIGTLIPSTKCVPDSATLKQVLSNMARMRHRVHDAPEGTCSTSGVCTGN